MEEQQTPSQTPQESQQVSQPQVQPQQPEVKPKGITLAKIIAWLMMLLGIVSLLIIWPFLSVGVAQGNWSLLGQGGLGLIEGVGLIIIAFGILKMRRWAFYAFIAVAILGFIQVTNIYITSPGQRINALSFIGIEVVVLLYFWSIYKKFN